jgi:hypothetical protein
MVGMPFGKPLVWQLIAAGGLIGLAIGALALTGTAGWRAYSCGATTCVEIGARWLPQPPEVTNALPIDDGHLRLSDSGQMVWESPAEWQVLWAARGDVTGDGIEDVVLLVWREWADWPIQAWLDVPSPIAGYHDADGQSCHVIVLDPATGREIWAGSALPKPLAAIAVGDVDGDGVDDLAALEGRYDAPRDAGFYAHVWRWNGFGFRLDWRSEGGHFRHLALADVTGDGVVEVLIR